MPHIPGGTISSRMFRHGTGHTLRSSKRRPRATCCIGQAEMPAYGAMPPNGRKPHRHKETRHKARTASGRSAAHRAPTTGGPETSRMRGERKIPRDLRVVAMLRPAQSLHSGTAVLEMEGDAEEERRPNGDRAALRAPRGRPRSPLRRANAAARPARGGVHSSAHDQVGHDEDDPELQQALESNQVEVTGHRAPDALNIRLRR